MIQIGGMDKDAPQETRRINGAMALAALELLRAITAASPPVSNPSASVNPYDALTRS